MDFYRESEIKKLCGLQDMYTDFDGWLCKYNKLFPNRYSTNKQISNNIKNVILTFDKLIVDGYISDVVNNRNVFLQIKYGGVGRRYLCQYTKSKLLFCFYLP
ncbi:hypothetical protein KGM_211502 [Danaus plexippus plexippus]|uniref:Uncharacterized protein n=1 Tax=Danaus plexippus plexippus TaxID=278856 RepID=A0A212FBT7_DANPL|nr:hypothetical protein KGM_211502 [Danaus plexippus plexippus]